ncbi:MAG: putative DNA-binding domain-containing protein [Bacteroidia bacterium]|nr:putative DNA-binding domain-containing protein [Bacteroidia bacterium]
MQLLETTRLHQANLASYCRTGDYTSIPGVNEKHVHHYRRLVYNVIDDTLRSAFPLTVNLLKPKDWTATMQRFFLEHPCQSPQVWTMPKEFYTYLYETQPDIVKKHPFLLELLLFEWLEVELYMMPDLPVEFSREGNLLTDRLVINPEHNLKAFSYPVHLKNAKFITLTDKGNYFLVMHRLPESGKVEFTDLSPFLVRMLELLTEQAYSLNELTSNTATEFSIEPDQQFYDQIHNFFARMMERKLILGFINN